jgi:hypothetical protein
MMTEAKNKVLVKTIDELINKLATMAEQVILLKSILKFVNYYFQECKYSYA